MNVICKNVQSLLFVTQILIYYGSHGYYLSNAGAVSKYVQDLIESFEKNPTDERFHSVIYPSALAFGKTQAEFLMPKVLIWSPLEQCH